MPSVLITPRLTLRELEAEDLDFVAGLLADPEVMRYWPRPLSRAEAVEWIERQRVRYTRDGYGFWLALDRESGEPVGQAGLAELEPPDPEGPSLGYIFDPRWWGRGLATEAAAACVRFGLEGCGKARVLCYVRPENEPSVRVARRLGLALARSEMYKGFEHLVFWTDGGSMGRG